MRCPDSQDPPQLSNTTSVKTDQNQRLEKEKLLHK